MLHQDIPAFPGRTFRQYLTTSYHHINRRRPDAGPDGLGCNSVNWIVEQVTATRQTGTHMDGLNHLQAGDRTFCTGHGGLWGTDNERYAGGEPGPGLALAGWLAGRRVELTGCDTTAHVRAADHPRTAPRRTDR